MKNHLFRETLQPSFLLNSIRSRAQRDFGSKDRRLATQGWQTTQRPERLATEADSINDRSAAALLRWGAACSLRKVCVFSTCETYLVFSRAIVQTQFTPGLVWRLAGHADPRTTRLYDRRDKKITRNIVERISI